MNTPRRITLATGLLALVLTAGCTDAPAPADTDAAAGDPTETSETTDGAAATSEDGAAADAAGMVELASLTGQETTLTLDDSVTNALSAVGVGLTATGGAQMTSADGMTTFAFPVTGGEATVDPGSGDPFSGTVQHEGGLRLSVLGQEVTVDQLVLDGAQDQLTAMVGGRRVPLLPLAMDPEVMTQEQQATLSWSATALDTGAVDSFAQQLNLPALPSLQVNELETTLEGS